ncbi:AraC family transcriptional regulator, partial [Pseudomonas umsongensis]|nr:AraC family transcriptional regulator [Pseudomonas umsongensis]
MPIESLHATRASNTRSCERLLHLRVNQIAVCLAPAQCVSTCCLPMGWEGLIAVTSGFEVNGSVSILPAGLAPLVK